MDGKGAVMMIMVLGVRALGFRVRVLVPVRTGQDVPALALMLAEMVVLAAALGLERGQGLLLRYLPTVLPHFGLGRSNTNPPLSYTLTFASIGDLQCGA
jgi:hypothetical protein